jgi:hypothetical protein
VLSAMPKMRGLNWGWLGGQGLTGVVAPRWQATAGAARWGGAGQEIMNSGEGVGEESRAHAVLETSEARPEEDWSGLSMVAQRQ